MKEIIFNSFYFGHWLSLQFLLWEGVVVLKEPFFNSFYLQYGEVVLKELILTVSMLGGCGGLERTDF